MGGHTHDSEAEGLGDFGTLFPQLSEAQNHPSMGVLALGSETSLLLEFVGNV